MIVERLALVVRARRQLASRRGREDRPRVESVRDTAEATFRFAPSTLSRAAWAEAVGELAATETRIDLARELGVRAAANWQTCADRLLPARALGLGADAIPSDSPGWIAAIAGRALGLRMAGTTPSLGQVGDALAWKELGLSGAPKRCPSEIRALFVQRRLGVTNSGDFERSVRLFVARELGAARPELRALRDALVRGWLIGKSVEKSDVTFAAAVARAVADPAARKFGDRKIYIASAWQTAALGLDLAAFKTELVAAHRRGEVALARADLVAAADPDLLAASETVAHGATFHFIVRQEHA